MSFRYMLFKRNKQLSLIQRDPELRPYADAIKGRYDYYLQRKEELTHGGSLSDFATGHLYFGLHKEKNDWVLREWAPNATAIYMVGDFNNWKEREDFALKSIDNGNWELKLPIDAIHHNDLYKLRIHWNGGCAERIPAWATRVVQDDNTKAFCAQVWDRHYTWKHATHKPSTSPLLIYECHIGMATEEERVGTYNEFREHVLPRIAKAGYNCIQIMAIQEHPYYGSFGYHVTNFFAPSSRFGTPEELKQLIDEAHGLGISVIMDIIHSHCARNEAEGLAMFDGTPYQYFHEGARRFHPAWDSLCFDYQKPAVLHFLLSNCKYWLQEFHFDGFRFDGVTSMMYLNHGLEANFTNYGDYYNLNEDGDAICYLTLANDLIHNVNHDAITIAEDMSGMPGLAMQCKDGGMGFDYRMAMGIPDFWIKYIKEVRDEDWKAGHIFWELTNRRADEKTISYAESHDQALVGDKTIIFRLIDSDMYWHMMKGDESFSVSRGIALHKMIRLATASTINGGYLNFMGNEFGHPEWIDFPREGNNWSYKYARRQWSLRDDERLNYGCLAEFDKDMLATLSSCKKFNELPIEKLWDNEGDQVVAYRRGKLLFVLNFNGFKSFTGYGILVKPGSYKIILNTDDKQYGGFGFVDNNIHHFTQPSHLDDKGWLKLYLPSRTALVLKEID